MVWQAPCWRIELSSDLPLHEILRRELACGWALVLATLRRKSFVPPRNAPRSFTGASGVPLGRPRAPRTPRNALGCSGARILARPSRMRNIERTWGSPSIRPAPSVSTLETEDAPRRLGPPACPPGRRRHPAGASRRNATWLILPVVICLSQRLSHACVSMNKFRL